MIPAPPGELDADSPAEPPNMHTWVVAGDAPSNGKGKRVSLQCTACEAVVNLRQRSIRNGALHACPCSGGVPPIYQLISPLLSRSARTIPVCDSATGQSANQDRRSIHEELRAEAMTVRMVETGPGTVKMSNPAGTHDDVLTAVGMVLADLTSQPEQGRGAIYSPVNERRVVRTLQDARPRPPARLAARWAARTGPRGLSGGAILGVPGAHDDPQRDWG